MGYYTQHSLSILPEGSVIDQSDHEKEISTLSGYDYCFSYPIKWYDHENDMRKYSKLYPNLIFVLRCEGEEFDDIRIEYYKNGKVQKTKAVLVFDQFDESKLI